MAAKARRLREAFGFTVKFPVFARQKKSWKCSFAHNQEMKELLAQHAEDIMTPHKQVYLRLFNNSN